MASFVASLPAPLMLHGGKTRSRVFLRPTASLRPAKVSVKENVLAPVETEERDKIGSSMWVPNVQEMVKKHPLLVPERYIRSPEEMENNKIMHHLSPFIPLIDFGLLKKGDKEELLKLDFACKEWGFFQLVNHGVEELMITMKDTTMKFFNLPLEEKEKYAMQEDMQGYGHIQVQNDDQKLDWSDALLLFTQPARQISPSVWPENPVGFKDIIKEYSSKVTQVGLDLLNYFSVNLGMQEGVLGDLHEEIASFLDINYYPPCHKPDQVIGMSKHSDSNTITLVMQDQIDVSELQIKHLGGWVPVNPISNALVVNVADLIEIWSNGRYKSIEHRVVTNGSKLRMTHVTSLLPTKDVHVEPLNHLIRSKTPKLYQKVKVGDYANIYRNRKLDGRAHIEEVMIKN
ncbi:hypothetical protein RIF29_30506 [Crotalaria pallida]|uniref:Fe2OG dioxygenase domain-containing protein n=1 Tax=Crotalaria pallida TaxID=3830 RepID=A0AAN9ELF0_CROPI